MKVEITTLELADLLNTVQGRHKVAQNPLGMSAEELIEKVSDRVTEKIVAAIEANAAEEQEDDRDDIPALISTTVNESFAKLEENLAKLSAHMVSPSATDAEADHLAEADKMVAPPEDGRAADETPDVVTLGDLYESERTADPDYPNEIVGKKEEPAAPEEPAKKATSMPVWDESAGVYVVNGDGHIGRDLWKKEPYYEFFNGEIRRLLKDGKSPRYIADRLKVRELSVLGRIHDAKIN